MSSRRTKIETKPGASAWKIETPAKMPAEKRREREEKRKSNPRDTKRNSEPIPGTKPISLSETFLDEETSSTSSTEDIPEKFKMPVYRETAGLATLSDNLDKISMQTRTDRELLDHQLAVRLQEEENKRFRGTEIGQTLHELDSIGSEKIGSNFQALISNGVTLDQYLDSTDPDPTMIAMFIDKELTDVSKIPKLSGDLKRKVDLELQAFESREKLIADIMQAQYEMQLNFDRAGARGKERLEKHKASPYVPTPKGTQPVVSPKSNSVAAISVSNEVTKTTIVDGIEVPGMASYGSGGTKANTIKGWAAIKKETGIKDGQEFVQMTQKAWDAADCTVTEAVTIMRMWKKLPIGTDDEIVAQYVKNVKAAKAKFDDAESSQPLIQLKAALPVFRSAMNKLRNTLGDDFKKVSWGSLSQVTYFMETAEDMSDEFQKLIPEGRQFVMGKFLYNALELKLGLSIMDERWAAFFKAYAWANNNGGFTYLKAGSVVNGRKIQSISYQWKRPETVAPVQYNLDSPNASDSLDEILAESDADIWELIAAANCPNYYILFQSKDVRQTKKNTGEFQLMTQPVIDRMAAVMRFTGKKVKTVDSIDPTSKFCQAFFDSQKICAATLRHMTTGIFGRQGGVNTRQNYGAIKYTVAPYKFPVSDDLVGPSAK